MKHRRVVSAAHVEALVTSAASLRFGPSTSADGREASSVIDESVRLYLPGRLELEALYKIMDDAVA